MSERVLTQRELNRAMLARQLLLERGKLSIPHALERIGGIQAQYAPAMYIGLWTRLQGFERHQLTRALERRSVVQGTLMRITIHLVSARDYWPFAVGVREARRRWVLRVRKDIGGPEKMEVSARRLRERIADTTMTHNEIRELLGGGQIGQSAGLWLDMVRVPPSGTWERRRADIYATAEDWLRGAPEVSPEQGVDQLVRSYLRGFGPAPRGDIASWAGLPLREVAASLERLELRRFRTENGQELVDLPRAPLPEPDTPAPVRLLPVWDATLLVNLRRTGVLPERHRSRTFNSKTPHSFNTFLVDGAVAGTWRYEGGRVRLDAFERIDRAAMRELRDEAARMESFHAP